MRDGSGNDRVKVAILGAGAAGLAAAHGLSRTASLRERYEVTVYQVGWRAGGKLASGRQGEEKRIAQNGTHYLFGCYENSFELAREAYAELNAAGDFSFGTYANAFNPVTTLVLKQFFRGNWHDWVVEVPTNREVPGTGGAGPGGADVLGMALQWLVEAVAGWKVARCLRPRPPFSPGFATRGGDVSGNLETATEEAVSRLLRAALELARRAPGSRQSSSAICRLLEQARRLFRRLLGSRIERDLHWCRRWILVDLGCSILLGMIEDDLLAPGGMAAIDHYDFREWLALHGASEVTLYSPLVGGWYESIAAFECGDRSRPNVSAGATVFGMMHATLGYKGAFAYQPRREMGDSFIAPIFEMLRRRGVKFRFFQRIWDLEPDGDVIGRILVEDQVELRCGDPERYEPFIQVKGLKAWPDRPLKEQIIDGDRLEGIDLEDFYTSWTGGRRRWLERGVDFDVAVYALPVESIRFYAAGILAEQESWRRMVHHVRGVDTRSLWLYFRPELRELGWPYPPGVLTGYTPPFSTWEATSYLIPCEDWPPGQAPGCIASLFGSLEGPYDAPAPDEPGDYPARQHTEAWHSARRFLDRDVGALWPRAASPENPLGVDWSLLVDLENRRGEERIHFQQVRANFGPIARYTQARAGALRYRLRPDESSYRNLFLAGDWVRNGVDIGCVEGAVGGGLLAAIAICGEGRLLGANDSGL